PAQQVRSTTLLSTTWPVYDRLLNLSEKGEYLPMLATDWSFSSDGTRLTLKLRQEVTFSDGTAFNAKAVKTNLKRYKHSKITAPLMSLIESVQIIDPHEVVLHLTQPSRRVLATLSSSRGVMVSP